MEERLADLLLAWEESREAGHPVPVEHLCRNCPELAEHVREHIAALQRVEWLDDLAQPANEQRLMKRLAPGVRVLSFRLVRVLGRGGFGEVWEAASDLERKVALKFVPVMDNQVRNEARVLDQLREITHAHLLKILGTWLVDGVLILALELGQETLHDRLQQVRRLGQAGIDRAELLRHMVQAAEALDYLHEKGIQHRDVKPQNLLFVGGNLKVSDFGLSRLMDSSMTGHSGAMTVAYAAPEFFEGQTSKHSDQYSLAVTYCELRGGRLPFVGEPAQIMAGHLRRPPDLSMVPEQERPALHRALAKTPACRWETCRQFVEVLESNASTSRQSSDTRTLVPGQRKTRSVVALACLAMLVLAIPLGIFINRQKGVHEAPLVVPLQGTHPPAPNAKEAQVIEDTGSPNLPQIVESKKSIFDGGADLSAALAEADSLPAIAFDDEGNYILAWSHNKGGNKGLYAQFFDADNRKTSHVMTLGKDSQFDHECPKVCRIGLTSSFAVVWQARTRTTAPKPMLGWKILARIIDKQTVLSGDPIQIDSRLGGRQIYPNVAYAAKQSALYFAWTDGSSIGGFKVVVKKFSDSGKPLGKEHDMNPTPMTNEANPVLAIFPGGKHFYTWAQWHNRKHADGVFGVARPAPELQAPKGTKATRLNDNEIPGQENYSCVASILSEKTVVAAWQLETGKSYCRIFDGDGNAVAGSKEIIGMSKDVLLAGIDAKANLVIGHDRKERKFVRRTLIANAGDLTLREHDAPGR